MRVSCVRVTCVVNSRHTRRNVDKRKHLFPVAPWAPVSLWSAQEPMCGRKLRPKKHPKFNPKSSTLICASPHQCWISLVEFQTCLSVRVERFACRNVAIFKMQPVNCIYMWPLDRVRFTLGIPVRIPITHLDNPLKIKFPRKRMVLVALKMQGNDWNPGWRDSNMKTTGVFVILCRSWKAVLVTS